MLRLGIIPAAMMLAACTTQPLMDEPAPAAPVQQASAEPVEAIKPQPVPEPEPQPIPVDLSRVENQTPADVLSYLGAPSLVRRDENVQVMIFESPSCVVEVIFFEPENGDHFRAHRVNARTRSGQDTDLEACTRQWLESTTP